MIEINTSTAGQLHWDMARHMPASVLREKLNAMAESMGDIAFGRRVAREMVAWTQPQRAVPRIHERYRAIVRDGIAFFISQVSRKRLIEQALIQLKMDPGVGSGERLLALATQFPTLHKLGQIIARNPYIDPALKEWLVKLEDGRYGTPENDLVDQIENHVASHPDRPLLRIHPNMLSEASVGGVFRFDLEEIGRSSDSPGVFKLLKPGIRRHVAEEVQILKKTAAFFESNRADYPLKNFRFLEVFDDVREMLIKEIDLTCEQRHLGEAARFYRDMPSVVIPKCFSFGNDTITAMAYLDGPKITDAELKPEHRKRCARVLFEAMVCRPLFSMRESALFHGDPHAGNILAISESDEKMPAIGLLDWSLAGYLNRCDRLKTIRLIQAIIKGDMVAIDECIYSLANGGSNEYRSATQTRGGGIAGLMHSPEFRHMPIVRKTFRLIEALSYEGYVFPANLMLFRKAVFTLEGVLNDIWPDFDMDAAVFQYLATLFVHEMPLRVGNLIFPFADRPETYPSLVSNLDLYILIMHQYMHAVRTGMQTLFDSMIGWRWDCGVLPFALVSSGSVGNERAPIRLRTS